MATQFEQLTLTDLPRLIEYLIAWQQGEGLNARRPVAERQARRLLGLGGAGLAWLIRIGGQPAGYLVVSMEGGAHGRHASGTVAGFFLVRSRRGGGIERQVEEFLRSVGRWLGCAMTTAPLVPDSLAVPRFRTDVRGAQVSRRTLQQATA